MSQFNLINPILPVLMCPQAWPYKTRPTICPSADCNPAKQNIHWIPIKLLAGRTAKRVRARNKCARNNPVSFNSIREARERDRQRTMMINLGTACVSIIKLIVEPCFFFRTNWPWWSVRSMGNNNNASLFQLID